MSFKEFTINNRSTREFVDEGVEDSLLSDLMNYLSELNSGIGKEEGFSFVFLKDGNDVFEDLDGYGGYGGVMIRSPHYIGLRLDDLNRERRVMGAYYMQSIVKKLYDMKLGSCWISLDDTTPDQQAKILSGRQGVVQYLLGFGKALEEERNEKAYSIINRTSKYVQDPYGLAIIDTEEENRLSVVETVFLYEWGNVAGFADMKNRGVLDLLYYVRNSPSYKNDQPIRLILQDGYLELAIIKPHEEENYTDGGVFLYMLYGLARGIGYPANWHYIDDTSDNKEYQLIAHFEL